MACEDNVISPKTAEHMTTAVCRLMCLVSFTQPEHFSLEWPERSFELMIAVHGCIQKPDPDDFDWPGFARHSDANAGFSKSQGCDPLVPASCGIGYRDPTTILTEAHFLYYEDEK